MALTVSPHLDDHLARTITKGKYSVSGQTVTIPTTTTLNQQQLAQLLEVTAASGHKISFGASGLTISPR